MIPEGKPGERRYGLDRHPELIAYCIEEVSVPPHQCFIKRGHGPNGEFCKQHAKRYEKGAP